MWLPDNEDGSVTSVIGPVWAWLNRRGLGPRWSVCIVYKFVGANRTRILSYHWFLWAARIKLEWHHAFWDRSNMTWAERRLVKQVHIGICRCERSQT